jgi:hypothetical protein
MSDNSKIQSISGGDKHNRFLMIPNIIFEIGLNAYQLALYVVIKKICGENGVCIKSIKKIAKDAGMCERKAIYTLETLCEINEVLNKPLLISTARITESGDRDTNMIKVVDIWDENKRFHKFDDIKEFNGGGAPHAPPPACHAPPGAQHAPGVVHHMHQGGAPHAVHIVQDHTKKTHMKKTAAVGAVAVVHKNNSLQENKEIEKNHAMQLKSFVDKQAKGTSLSDSWNDKWIMSENIYISLCQEYGSSYVMEQVNHMIRKERDSIRDSKSAKQKKTTPVEKPESFLKMSCEKNWAKSFKGKTT